jgi:hypothetical protein
MEAKGYFETRLAFDKRRERLWTALCRHYFDRIISKNFTVLELGAGYGHFINNVDCRRRIAVDAWEGMLDSLKEGVEGRVGDITRLDFLEDESVDFVFASNLFEHVSQAAFASVLGILSRKLRKEGTLNILQPNYRYCYDEYFDDYTHVSVYSDRSICDFLNAHGFEVIQCEARFLPLTVKSRLPAWPWLIRLYLSLPVKPMGKQMFVRARLRRGSTAWYADAGPLQAGRRGADIA